MDIRIIAFASESYAEITSNWLHSIDRLGLLGHVTIIALDQSVQRTMAARGVRCELRPPPSSSLAGLWSHRIVVLHDLLSTGTEGIIHSDADAVWLRDPRQRVIAEDTDLVFSQGSIWPPESISLRRFVLCCGFFFVRPTIRSRAFFTTLLDYMNELANDQWAVNRLVDQHRLNWTINDPYHLSFQEVDYIASRVPMRGIGDNLSVSTIPHHEIPRIIATQSLEDVLVAHPLSGKTAVDTERVLRHHNLWFLPDGP